MSEASKKQFTRGLILRPDDVALVGTEGELKIGTTTKSIHAYLDSAVRTVVTTDQTQTLTNKSLDADNNTVANLETDNLKSGVLNTSSTFVGATDTQVPSALAVKTAIDAINADLTDDVEGPASAIDNAVARFDGTTGKLLQGSTVSVSDSGTISRTTTNSDITVTGNGTGRVVLGGGVGVFTQGYEGNAVTIPDNVSSGAGVLVINPSKNIRLNDNTLSPIDTISGGASNGQEITFMNVSGSDYVFNNLSGSPASQQIRTGQNAALTLRDGDSINLVYNESEQKWHIIGSQFKGTTTSVDNTLPRFDGTTGQFVQESNVVVNDSDEMSGITKLNVDNVEVNGNEVKATSGDLSLNSTSGDVVTEVNSHSKGTTRFEATTDAVTTGANATVPLPTTKHIRLTDTSLTSIDMIQTPGGYQEIILQNLTGNDLTISNNTGATAAWRILTGTSSAITIKENASVHLAYDATFSAWRVVGGVGEVDGPASATDHALARFDTASGKLIQNSVAILDDAGALSGLTELDVDDININGNTISSTGSIVINSGAGSTTAINGISNSGVFDNTFYEDSTATGADATVDASTSKNIYLSNPSLISVALITAAVDGQEITLVNKTTNPVIILNDATPSGGDYAILTGTDADLTLAPDASISLVWLGTDVKWQVIGGTGAGGGSASLDTIFQLTATEQLADWATGDDATFLGGGTLSGTFDYNTSTPLSGDQSYRYTQAAGSLNDYLASPAQDVDLRFRGQNVTLYFPFKYDGATNDIEVVFYDVTNAAIIPSSAFLNNSPTVSIFKSNIVIPSTCSSIRVGFQTDVLNSGKILEFADVQLTSDATVYADIDNDLQSNYLFVAGTVTNAIVSGAATRTSGSGIYSYNSATGVYTMLKRGKVTVSYGGLYAATSCQPTIRRNSVGVANSIQANGGLTTTTAYTEVLDIGVTFDCYASGGISSNYVSVSASASNTNILTVPETFSSDTAAFTYAGSATYTPATLMNAPVGTYITHTVASGGNVRTQTTARPTQTDTDMNANGIRLYGRAFNATSTNLLPAVVQIQVGKALRGFDVKGFNTTAKAVGSEITSSLYPLSSTVLSGLETAYNPTTGILTLDVATDGGGTSTTRRVGSSGSGTFHSDAYFVLNCSKNPALTGMNVLTPKIATISDVRASGTSGGGSTGGTWHTRTLNTLVDSSGVGVGIGSNQFTLPVGTYYIEGNAIGYSINNHRLRIRNITAGTTSLIGVSSYAPQTSPTSGNISFVSGEIVVSSLTTFELQHYAGVTQAINAFGPAISTGENEVFANIKIQKIR